MKLNDEERRIMVNLEYEKALSFLEQAEKVAAMDLWDVVANRLYYSIFHAVSALLIKDLFAKPNCNIVNELDGSTEPTLF